MIKTHIGRFKAANLKLGVMGLLMVAAMLFLAACGDAAATPTTQPAADATMTMDMGTPMDMPTQDPNTAALPTATAAPADSGSTGNEVDATMREWAIDLSTNEVAAGTITFKVTNKGQFAHNFAIKDASGNQLEKTANFSSADGVQTVTIELAAGTYTVYCALPGHEQQGQKNTITVK